MSDGILDTSFFIDIRRGRDNEAARLWDAIMGGTRTAAFSAVTAYELWVGTRFTREEEILFESMFTILEAVPISITAAKLAGMWLRNVPDRSEALSRDALIAASALERGEAVITRNVDDFSFFPGVRVESY